MWRELQKEGYDLLVRSGGFECFPAHPEQKIKTPDGVVKLSDREFRLFLNLLTTPREVVTFEEIDTFMQWTELEDPRDATRRVIKGLRKKTGKDNVCYIKSNPLFGYYFDPCPTST